MPCPGREVPIDHSLADTATSTIDPDRPGGPFVQEQQQFEQPDLETSDGIGAEVALQECRLQTVDPSTEHDPLRRSVRSTRVERDEERRDVLVTWRAPAAEKVDDGESAPTIDEDVARREVAMAEHEGHVADSRDRRLSHVHNLVEHLRRAGADEERPERGERFSELVSSFLARFLGAVGRSVVQDPEPATGGRHEGGGAEVG